MSGAAGLTVVRLNRSSFPEIRDIVLVASKSLASPDHFITSDIDTALPNILDDSSGIFLGVRKGAALVGVQGVDLKPEEQVVLTDSAALGLPLHYAESGWAIVDPQMRGRGISNLLWEHLVPILIAGSDLHTVIATAHPENGPALRMYIRLGFVGIDVVEHYGLPRVVLARPIRSGVELVRGSSGKPSSAETMPMKIAYLRSGQVIVEVIDDYTSTWSFGQTVPGFQFQ